MRAFQLGDFRLKLGDVLGYSIVSEAVFRQFFPVNKRRIALFAPKQALPVDLVEMMLFLDFVFVFLLANFANQFSVEREFPSVSIRGVVEDCKGGSGVEVVDAVIVGGFE